MIVRTERRLDHGGARVIGWLSGRVLHQLRNGALLIDVRGVGYEVHLASSDPPPFDELLELFIYTVVREDAIQLFGFYSAEEREFFELLIATPGVGPSTALGALRTMSVAELAYAIDSEDVEESGDNLGHRAQDRQPHRAGTQGQGGQRERLSRD